MNLTLFSGTNIDSSVNIKNSLNNPAQSKGIRMKIPWEKDFDKIPKQIKFNKLEKDKCASYALLSSQENFGYKYWWKDAWNIRYSSDTESISSSDELYALRIKGSLKQGYLVGFYYPDSPRNGEIDCQGNKRAYTHVAIFMGKNKNGKLVFDHQIGKKQERKTLEELSDNYSMKPIEIINPIEKI